MVHLGIVLTVFAIIFVAELPDKTMIATLIMGSRFRPVLVWLGSTLAFGVHAALAVAVGQLLDEINGIENAVGLLFRNCHLKCVSNLSRKNPNRYDARQIN